MSEEEAAVIDKIEAIGEVTLDSEAAIKEARAAYDALPEDSQAKIADYAAVLTDAEAALKELHLLCQSGGKDPDRSSADESNAEQA